MWNVLYDELKDREKENVKRIINYLFSHTYILKHKYNNDKDVLLTNEDYSIVDRNFQLLKEYFIVAGWELNIDNVYGVASVKNNFGKGLLLDEVTVLFLLAFRIIFYDEQNKKNNVRQIKTATNIVMETLVAFNIFPKSKNTTIKEREKAFRILQDYNIIQKTKNTDEWIIYPSILEVISEQTITELNNCQDENEQVENQKGNGENDENS